MRSGEKPHVDLFEEESFGDDSQSHNSEKKSATDVKEANRYKFPTFRLKVVIEDNKMGESSISPNNPNLKSKGDNSTDEVCDVSFDSEDE